MATYPYYTTSASNTGTFTITSNSTWDYATGHNIIYHTSSGNQTYSNPPPQRICTIKEDKGVDGSWLTTEYDSHTGEYVSRWLGKDKAEYSRKAKSKKDALAFHQKWVQTNITVWEQPEKRQKRQLLL